MQTSKCIIQLGVIAEKENLVESLKAKDSKISELESSQSASSKSINDAQIKISELTSELESKKTLTALAYATQMSLTLDDKKRCPSSDLNISQKNDKMAELNKKLCTYTTTQRDFRNQHW